MRLKALHRRPLSLVATSLWLTGILLLAGCGGTDTTPPAGEGSEAGDGTPPAAETSPAPDVGKQGGASPETPVDKEDPNGEGEIRRVFASYRVALGEADGETAADLVSSGTFELGEKYRDWALTADAATVKGLPLVNRLNVLLLRQCVDPALLRTMDGRAVYVHAVDENWIGNSGAIRTDLGDVAVDGLSATGDAKMGDVTTSEKLHFVKEDGQWKIDILPTLESAELAMQKVLGTSGTSENEYIFSTVTSLSGQQVTDEIWQPLE